MIMRAHLTPEKERKQMGLTYILMSCPGMPAGHDVRNIAAQSAWFRQVQARSRGGVGHSSSVAERMASRPTVDVSVRRIVSLQLVLRKAGVNGVEGTIADYCLRIARVRLQTRQLT